MERLESTRLGTAPRGSRLMEEAIRLAGDGELGNSDAIRLLQIPHCAEDVKSVLQRFHGQLSREAKSKLTLEALVPLPAAVDNQRYEPLFDKYLIAGETYTTASGIVVPDELQYYNGEMVQLYGECGDVARVNDSLAGSGYTAMTLEYAAGRRTAVAQLWSIRFTDSTIQPYSAMFIVVAAVRNDRPGRIRADDNGASSVLAMFDGSFDQTTAVYENTATLFMVRLLDTTRVAIEVGRERMGTDKRPGTVDMTREGRRLSVSIRDGNGRGVVMGHLELAGDSAAYLPEVANAAATAGIPFRLPPRGTEYSYPAVARIGTGPLVGWQWRSDLVPRLQSVARGAFFVDESSEEGRILRAWDFRPTALGYIPNVRGVITGLARQNRGRRHGTDAPVEADCGDAYDSRPVNVGGVTVNQAARDGSVMSWGAADVPSAPFVAEPGAPVPVSVAVSPIRPGHVVTVDYRLDGGPLRQVTAVPAARVQGMNARLFRATIPGQAGGLVEFLPVLRLAGQPISPRLGELAEPLTYQVRRVTGPAVAVQSLPSGEALTSRQPRWAWDSTFLGSMTARLRKERVGVTPDGFRIDWHVVEGTFVGPGLDLVVLPGAADWMRIRKDGIGIANVQVCLETRTGARIYVSYGGIVDLGPNGYAGALRDEYETVLPIVVTPTCATADPQLDWLNRVQCIGVGRMNMAALRVEFDVYSVRVEGPTTGAGNAESGITRAPVSPGRSLYQRLGGYDVMAPLAEEFIASIFADRKLGRFFVSGFSEARVKAIRQQVVDQLCALTGGSCVYTGRDMKTVHQGLGITGDDWKTAIGLLVATLNKYKVARQEQSEFVQILEDMKGSIVEKP